MSYSKFADNFLTPPVKARFMKNRNPTYIYYRYPICFAYDYLQNAFNWRTSPEGASYWRGIWDKLHDGGSYDL